MMHGARRNELFLAITILIICLIFGLTNRTFFTFGNVFDLLQSGVETGIFALGVLVVIISGGIDVSFTAIAIFSLYATVKIFSALGNQANIFEIFVVAALIGAILGTLNAVFIAYFKLPTLIVTLGTMGLFQGAMLVFFGTATISNIPSGMVHFGQSDMFSISTKHGTLGLGTYFLFWVVSSIIVWFILKYTMIGRGIYAVGSDPTAAKRVGFNIVAIQFFIYCLCGLLAGIAGIIHGTIIQSANPFDLVGTELDVIAAVVLGGARITGGHGTVTGTLLGVALVDIINNSLVLLGVPAYWQQAIIGVLILVGTGITASNSRKTESFNLIEG